MAQAKKEKSRGVDSGWVGPKALNNRRWSSFQEVNFLINVQAASACDLENYSYSQTKQRSSLTVLEVLCFPELRETVIL